MTRRKFSREFKTEAVKLVSERGVAVAQAARDLDVAESVLRRWMRELTAAPTAAFPGLHQKLSRLFTSNSPRLETLSDMRFWLMASPVKKWSIC